MTSLGLRSVAILLLGLAPGAAGFGQAVPAPRQAPPRAAPPPVLKPVAPDQLVSTLVPLVRSFLASNPRA